MTTFGQSPNYLGGIQGLTQPAVSAGSCMLTPNESMIRPKIGGRRRTKRRLQKKRRTQKRKQQKGGFLPSVGEGFAVAAHKYIAPIALYGIYKFLNGKTRKQSKKGKKTSRV
jgi:hypothetical protein